MSERDDEIAELLPSLDPAAIDAPPEPGSIRYDHIEDTIMTNIGSTTPTDLPPPEPSTPALAGTSRRLILLGAAAALVAVVGLGLLLAPTSTSGAEATVRTAAENSAEVTDFRIIFASDDFDFVPGGEAMVDIDGENVHMIAGDQEYIRFGDTEWFGEGGEFQSAPVVETWTPFGQASAEVVSAALSSEQVDDEGSETIRGTETTRYRIELDQPAREALAEVPSQSQYWFIAEGEEDAEFDESGTEVPGQRYGFLEDAEVITIWVADELIHQIEVSTETTTFAFTFFDFGADITVTPPG